MQAKITFDWISFEIYYKENGELSFQKTILPFSKLYWKNVPFQIRQLEFKYTFQDTDDSNNPYDYHRYINEIGRYATFNEIIWHPKFEESYKFHDVAVLKIKGEFKNSIPYVPEMLYSSIEKMTKNLMQALRHGNHYYPQNDKGWYGLLDIWYFRITLVNQG